MRPSPWTQPSTSEPVVALLSFATLNIFFYFSHATVELFFNVFSPKTHDFPSLSAQSFGDELVSSNVTLYFFKPELFVRMYRFFALFPILPVPEFAVAKDDQVEFAQNDVRFSYKRFAVFTIPIPLAPQSFLQRGFYFASAGFDGLHRFSAFFFC